ncbi:iron-sulfur cluster assembly protein [Pedobacter sp. UYP30]
MLMFYYGNLTNAIGKNVHYYLYLYEIKRNTMSTAVDSTFAPVTFSEGATKELNKLKDQQEISEDYGLRVGVEGGGCSGMNYILGFDQRKEGDQEYFIEGIKVFMNKAHQMYLMGMMIDWQDGLNARGFTFINPNATSTCGCGTSFSA